MDEIDLQLNNRPKHVVAEKGSKNVVEITLGEKGGTISVLACYNSKSLFIPHMCIFKNKNKKINTETVRRLDQSYVCRKNLPMSTHPFSFVGCKTNFFLVSLNLQLSPF